MPRLVFFRHHRRRRRRRRPDRPLFFAPTDPIVTRPWKQITHIVRRWRRWRRISHSFRVLHTNYRVCRAFVSAGRGIRDPVGISTFPEAAHCELCERFSATRNDSKNAPISTPKGRRVDLTTFVLKHFWTELSTKLTRTKTRVKFLANQNFVYVSNLLPTHMSINGQNPLAFLQPRSTNPFLRYVQSSFFKTRVSFLICLLGRPAVFFIR